jgi:hypothetical protein
MCGAKGANKEPPDPVAIARGSDTGNYSNEIHEITRNIWKTGID